MGYENDFEIRAETLQEACLCIKNIVSSSEKDFLAIGDYLAEFGDRAGKICERALTASQLLGADRIQDLAAKLRHILEAAVSRASAARESLNQNVLTLKQMIIEIGEISVHLGDFSRTLKTLRVLGISTRIESSRFRDTRFRFDSLADEVERSASVIETVYKEMCRQVRMLSDTLDTVLSKALKADNMQKTNTALIMEKLRSSLDSLEQKQSSIFIGTESLSARSNDVVTSISEVVMSLQFHDICRQQMEHVGQAIGDVGISLRAADREGQKGLQAVCASACRICALQMAQLAYTKETIFEAVERIIAGMDRIAGSVESINSDIHEMLSADDARGESYLSRVEEEAKNILSLLDESRKTGSRIGAAIRSVTEISSSISESVESIRNIVDDIKLLSLNARIKAAIAGHDGRSVSVLSEAIERLAGEMNKNAEILAHSFSMLSEGALQLECRLDAAGCRSEEQNQLLLTDLDSVQLESIEADGQAMGLLSQMREEGRLLADSIRSVTENEITVHRTARSVLEGVEGLIKEVVDGLRPLAGNDPSEEGTELCRLQDRYTMESERQIHRGQSLDVSPVSFDQADTFGDNVELF